MPIKPFRPAALCLLVAFSFCAAPLPSLAQNTSSVSSPEVDAGERGFEYRAVYQLQDDGKAGAFAHRLHYEQAFDDHWLGRVILLQSERGGEALTFHSVAFEVVRQFLESEATGGWDSAIRADGLIPLEDDKPGRARIAWLNSFKLDERWKLRANIYVGREMGHLARDGFTIETREELTRKFGEELRIGVQAFNNFNTTSHIGSYNEQRHQVGPVIKGAITDRLSYAASALFGVSRDAADADFRLFITYWP